MECDKSARCDEFDTIHNWRLTIQQDLLAASAGLL